MISLVIVTVILACAVVLTSQRRRRDEESRGLDARVVTVDDVVANIRRDVAPSTRPYGDGGVRRDEGGRMYAVDRNGSLRRVAIARRADGGVDVVTVKSASKRARKAAKKNGRRNRGEIVTRIEGA